MRKVKRAKEIFINQGMAQLVMKSLLYMYKRLYSVVYSLIGYTFFTIIRTLLEITSCIYKSSIHDSDKIFVLCGAHDGYTYRGNSKYLFESLIDDNRFKTVWMTKSDKVYNELSNNSKPVVSIHSPKALYYYIVCDVYCFTHVLKDISIHPQIIPRNALRLYVGHGRPVKATGMSKKGRSDYSRMKLIFFYLRHRDIKISRSMFMSRLDEMCNPIGLDNYRVTGYPRTDALFLDETSNQHFKDFELVLLYAPTKIQFRELELYKLAGDNMSEFIDYLQTNNILLLFRPHPKDTRENKQNLNQSVREFIDQVSNCDNIKMATKEKFPDIYTILPEVDILLTDYSSIYHDFLLLDRAIIFLDGDYEEYKKSRGLLYDYKNSMPGVSPDDFGQLITYLDKVKNGGDLSPDNRNKLKNKMHKYQDGKSTNRVKEMIISEVR